MNNEQSKQAKAVRDFCKHYLSEDRYRHLERVFQTMIELNKRKSLGISDDQMALAGFGHDIARELPGEISALLLEQAGMELEPWEHEFKLFCHSRASIVILRQCFGVEDAEVFQAMKCHTLGDAGLCTLAKLLYVADFLEPKRHFLQPEERQKCMDAELNSMVYEVCRRTSKFLQDNDKPILPPTRAMIKELEQELAISSEQRFDLNR